MGNRLEDLIVQILANPPDPHEKLPVSNRKETIWGTTLTFLVRIDLTYVPSTKS
jgi:hypothetical protein